MPKRIQRKRTKGWRMPANTVYVGRPTKWGNDWNWGNVKISLSANQLKKHYRNMIIILMKRNSLLDISELRGKDLACWCPLDQPCHADVLLELAN